MYSVYYYQHVPFQYIAECLNPEREHSIALRH
jgi:hypothetical protein